VSVQSLILFVSLFDAEKARESARVREKNMPLMTV